jgi:hypothetical protein
VFVVGDWLRLQHLFEIGPRLSPWRTSVTKNRGDVDQLLSLLYYAAPFASRALDPCRFGKGPKQFAPLLPTPPLFPWTALRLLPV